MILPDIIFKVTRFNMTVWFYPNNDMCLCPRELKPRLQRPHISVINLIKTNFLPIGTERIKNKTTWYNSNQPIPMLCYASLQIIPELFKKLK